VAKGVEVPHTKGWAPWPTGLHATEEEKRKKEEEKKKEEEQKKKEEERRTEEEERGASGVASPLCGSLVEGVPDSSPQQQ
jgi:hypothetical protein